MKYLLLSTRKGLIIYARSDNQWQYQATHFLGIPVSLSYVDQRTNTWWACLDHGHWGVKLHRSIDEGVSWTEVDTPKFPEGSEVKEGRLAVVKYLWAMAAGGEEEPGVLYLGTDPGALFKSENDGLSWELVRSLWDHPSRSQWFGGGRENPGIHSIIVDPRDSDHLYIAISCAGVFESKDGCKSWHSANKGLKADFLPDPDSEIGQDPHILVVSQNHPDHMWQQNHCGIFYSKDGAKNWVDVSESEGPANFGFAIVVDEKDPESAWVAPAISDEIRVAVDQSLCISRTGNGGKTWQALRSGLPQEQCFDIVFRHAMDKRGDHIVFGTTTGNAYFSNNRGDGWQNLSTNLPLIYAVLIV
ncbi:MAG: glycosyl hydrolase [Cyclobacteriaceae bacterium]